MMSPLKYHVYRGISGCQVIGVEQVNIKVGISRLGQMSTWFTMNVKRILTKNGIFYWKSYYIKILCWLSLN